MITILTSKRHRELLDKERAADAIDDALRFKAAFSQWPDLDVQRELAAIHASVNNAHARAELGSVVQSHLLEAQLRLGALIKATS